MVSRKVTIMIELNEIIITMYSDNYIYFKIKFHEETGVNNVHKEKLYLYLSFYIHSSWNL